MKLKATFIGENSLGYEKGKEYTLYLFRFKIRRENNTGVCDYKTVEAFIKNWDNIKHL